MTGRDARIEAVRREIDAIDTELLGLLNRRAAAALEVAAIKRRRTRPRYYRPEREAALFRRLAASNEGPLPDTEAVRLFHEIVSTCRALEQRPAIACTTVAGACAALGHFGGAVDLHVAPDAAKALAAVAASAAVSAPDEAAGSGAVAGTASGVVEEAAAVAGEMDGGAGETAGAAGAPAVAGRARCDYAVIEFSPGGEADPAVADVAGAGLVLCGEWCAASGERYVVVGREPVPPTGDDRASFVVTAGRARDFESRSAALDLGVRWTPVAGRASWIADVAAHTADPRLSGLIAECGGGCALLGAYPNARIGGSLPDGGRRG